MLALSAYLIYSIPLTAYVKPEYRSKKKHAMLNALVRHMNRDREIDEETRQKVCQQIEEETRREIAFNKIIKDLNKDLNKMQEESSKCRKGLAFDLQRAQTLMRNQPS